MAIRLFTFLACCLLLTACGSDDDGGSSSGADQIAILSTSPSSLPVDEPTTVYVEVQYTCSSYERGVIYVGCNSSAVDEYRILESHTVERGSGVVAIAMIATARDWGSTGEFSIMANLSDAEHGSSWTPAASDFRIVPVTDATQADDELEPLLIDQ